MDNTAYWQGFIDKCAEYDVDPRSLVKFAISGTMDNNPSRLSTAVSGQKRLVGKLLGKANANKAVVGGPLAAAIAFTLTQAAGPAAAALGAASGSNPGLGNRLRAAGQAWTETGAETETGRVASWLGEATSDWHPIQGGRRALKDIGNYFRGGKGGLNR